jgi:type II secretory pathway predicted ATPase ExeA
MGGLLLNWNTWPKTTPAKSIKQQTITFLRTQDVPENLLNNELWQELDGMERNVRHKARPQLQAATPEAVCGSDNEDDEEKLPENVMLSQAAKKHFHLFQDPFMDDVQGPEDVYLSSEQRYIREAMFQAAKHAGFLAVVGESGAGKTVLRKDLIDRIQREGHPITLIQPRIIDKERLTAGAICDAIIGDISSDDPRRSLEAKARQIEELLVGSCRAGNSHVLLIEEAHDLTIQTLKYLKRFWELEDGFRRLMAIILVGQSELHHKLDERRHWEAREVIKRCEVAELRPLNGNLEEYLGMKFKRVSKGLDDVFMPDAFDAIRSRLVMRKRGSTESFSMLYPLNVNNTVKKAMNMAAEIGEAKINAEIIKGV